MTAFAIQNRSRRLHALASYVELGICLVLVTLFVVLQFSSTVGLVSDFNWINFIDFDNASQVEQFLGNLHEDSVEALPNLPWAYGSEFFLMIPFYRLLAAILGGMSSLDAYRFLQVLHIIAAGLSLLLLRVVIRQSGAPVFIPVLVIALVVSSPLFYVTAHLLKPDVNIVLFLLMASYWALLKFYGHAKSGWLVSSIALAALAAAIKWWGVFLLIPQLYLVAVRDGFGPPFKPPIGCWRLLVANTISCAVLVLTLVVHVMPLVQKFPYSRRVITLAIGATALLVVVCFGLLTLSSWLLLRPTDNSPTAPSSMALKLTRLSYCFLSIGCVFASNYLVFAAPFLLSDQLAPSIGYYSGYLLVIELFGSPTGSMVSDLIANVSQWLSGIGQSGLLPLLLTPALLGSTFLLLWGPADQDHRRLRALAIFPALLVGFMFFSITKVHGGVLTMILPFIATLAIAPVAIWAIQLRALSRNVVLTALVLLTVSQTVLQAGQTVDMISSYRQTIETISTLNDSLVANIKKVAGADKKFTLFTPGRDFPIHSGVSGTKHLAEAEYAGLLERMGRSCDSFPSGRRLGKRNTPAIFLLIQMAPDSSFVFHLGQVEKLRNMGCLDLVSEIVGDSYFRGSRQRHSYALYQIPRL